MYMTRRDTGLNLFDSDLSEDYVLLDTEVSGWAMAAGGSRRSPANICPQPLPTAAGAAPGSIAKRRRLPTLRLNYVIAGMFVDDAPHPRRVVALSNAIVAECNAFVPHGLSLCSIAEPAPSVWPGRSDADGAVLPLDLLPLIQRPAGAQLRIRGAREPPLGPGAHRSPQSPSPA